MWIYHTAIKHAFMGDLTYKAGGGDFRVALLTSTYAFSATIQRTHESWSDITNEVSDGNYVSKGAALTEADPTVVNDTTYKVYIMQNHADTVWAGPCSFTARYAVIHQYNATAGLDLLIACEDFGSDKTCSAGSFTLDWDASATFKVSPAIFA
jgi:hypothetical protein